MISRLRIKARVVVISEIVFASTAPLAGCSGQAGRRGRLRQFPAGKRWSGGEHWICRHGWGS